MSESLFVYNLRESSRAKSIRLRVTPQKGLEVIIPSGYDRSRIPKLLDRKKHWIRIALDRAEAARQFFEPRPSWKLPAQIHLQAIGLVFHVEAIETEAPSVIVRSIGHDTIKVYGSISDERGCKLALNRWLGREARSYLVPRLQTLSGNTGLKYKGVFIRQQKTRWASCSRHRNISLNLKLLFLPPSLVDYVFIHELCHLAEMSHSKKFWSLVEANCPGYRKLDKQLREMWKIVPHWAFNSIQTNTTQHYLF